MHFMVFTTVQGPVQPPKFDVLFGSAVSVVRDPLTKVCEHVPVVVAALKLQSIAPVPVPFVPVTIPPPVAPVPGVTLSVKFPVPVLNVAVICSFCVTVTEQVAPETVQGVPLGVPQPPNTAPGPGVAVKVTAVPVVYVVEQVPVAGGPDISAQLICGLALPTTVPTEVPSSSTSKLKLVAAVTVSASVGAAVPGIFAVIVVGPLPTAVTNPLELIVATPVLEDVHVAELVRSWNVPSLKVPSTVSCSVFPTSNDCVVATIFALKEADAALVSANMTASGWGALVPPQLVHVA
jgi:hypothetical protein